MKQVPDRKRLRREYLRKKGWVYTRMTFFQLLTVFAGLGALFFFSWYNRPWWMGEFRGAQEIPAIARYCFGGFMLVCVYVLVRSQYKVAQIKQEKAEILPVIPDLLPAEEILVRGSEEPPVAQSEVLLRAAKGGETPKEELLRVSHE